MTPSEKLLVAAAAAEVGVSVSEYVHSIVLPDAVERVAPREKAGIRGEGPEVAAAAAS